MRRHGPVTATLERLLHLPRCRRRRPRHRDPLADRRARRPRQRRPHTVVTAPPPSSTIDAAPDTGHAGSTPTDVSDIYARVAPGVAFISASGAPATTPFGGQEQSSATGSGFLIDGKGHVVTNDHVVEGARRFTVRFGEDGRALDAKLV